MAKERHLYDHWLVPHCRKHKCVARWAQHLLESGVEINCNENLDSMETLGTTNSPQKSASSVHLSLNVFLMSFYENAGFMSRRCPGSLGNCRMRTHLMSWSICLEQLQLIANRLSDCCSTDYWANYPSYSVTVGLFRIHEYPLVQVCHLSPCVIRLCKDFLIAYQPTLQVPPNWDLPEFVAQKIPGD